MDDKSDKILFYKYFYSKDITNLEILLNKNKNIIESFDEYKLLNFILINDLSVYLHLFDKLNIVYDTNYIHKYKILYNCRNIIQTYNIDELQR